MGDQLRIAWMVESFHAGDSLPQPGVMKADIFDQFCLCIRGPGDQDGASIGDRFSDFMKIVGTRRCVPAPDRICLVMDVSGRIVRVQDECFDLGRTEMKHTGFTVIDPDQGMIVVFGQNIDPFRESCEHDC